MKKAVYFLVFILAIMGCSKEDKPKTYRHEDISGRWYGSLGKQWSHDEEDRYLVLYLDKGKVTLDKMFSSYTSGWYESKGTYTLGMDNVIRFDITTDIPDILEDIGYSDITYKTITHAEIAESALDGTILKVHYEATKDGITENHWMWFDRDRP